MLEPIEIAQMEETTMTNSRPGVFSSIQDGTNHGGSEIYTNVWRENVEMH
jgi:hypothetical protein